MGYGPWLTATGSYSKSSGQALATGAGLVPVPVPSPILPSSLVSLYGGDGYSLWAVQFSGKKADNRAPATPSRSAILPVTQARVQRTRTTNINALIQYQVRKLGFTSGYSRLEQGFSGSGAPPESISSYYIGVSRWFKFF